MWGRATQGFTTLTKLKIFPSKYEFNLESIFSETKVTKSQWAIRNTIVDDKQYGNVHNVGKNTKEFHQHQVTD